MKTTGHQLLAIARQGRPNVEYRLDKAHGSIAANLNGQWHRVAGKTIRGDEWFALGDLLINGQRIPFDPDLAL